MQHSFFDTRIEFLKGVGTSRALLLNTELQIFTYGDLIQYYPFRYEDRTKFHQISELNEGLEYAQIKGKLRFVEKIGEGHKARLTGQFSDGSGTMELTWFQGVTFLERNLRAGADYVIYGTRLLSWSPTDATSRDGNA